MINRYEISKIVNSYYNDKTKKKTEDEDNENNQNAASKTTKNSMSTDSQPAQIVSENVDNANELNSEKTPSKTEDTSQTSFTVLATQPQAKQIVQSNNIASENENNTNKNKSASEIISELKDIERNLSQNNYVDAPESLGLQTVDVPNKTEVELVNLAKASLDSKYNEKKQTTSDNFSKQIESILSSNENLKKNAETSSQQISALYDESIKETEAQALKRGLARSSIIISQIAGLSGEKASELSGVLTNLNNSLTEAENKIASLESEKQIALQNLDLEYAIELETEIEATRQDYEKARQEAIEFNNNVAKLEAEYKLKLDAQKQDKQSELTELENKYGVDYTTNLIKNEQFNYLKNYLDSLDKDYAISLFLTNKEFQAILGDRYSEMYQYLKNK